MSRLELWFFRRIVKREVIQGGHVTRIVRMYSEIHDAAERQFTEDNTPTLNGFLTECHAKSLPNGEDIA